MPDAISDVVVADFNVARERHGIAVDALSATYNMIHPDSGLRSQGAAQFEVLARFAKNCERFPCSRCARDRVMRMTNGPIIQTISHRRHSVTC